MWPSRSPSLSITAGRDITNAPRGVINTGPGNVYFINPTATETAGEQPNVTLKFVYPKSPGLVLVNQSGKIAKEIKWMVALWNLDDPRTYINSNPTPDAHDPLPIPVSTFDFLRPHSAGGPQNLFNTPSIVPHLKPGNRLFGSASVICPDCGRGHTYLVYIVWDQGGWFYEVPNITSGEVLIPRHFTTKEVSEYLNDSLSKIPEVDRIAIGNL